MYIFCYLRVLGRKLASPLATQRKSLRNFNLRALANTCRSVCPGLNKCLRSVGLQREKLVLSEGKNFVIMKLFCVSLLRSNLFFKFGCDAVI